MFVLFSFYLKPYYSSLRTGGMVILNYCLFKSNDLFRIEASNAKFGNFDERAKLFTYKTYFIAFLFSFLLPFASFCNKTP